VIQVVIQRKGREMADKSKYEANAQFAKLQRAQDAKKAASEYETEAAAVRAKTERLKALRLARDAAAPPPKPAAPKRKTKKKGKESSLSDWLDGQAKEGRNG
jgi:membrane protein involved in colicin uptake